jgi:hypothetical protein
MSQRECARTIEGCFKVDEPATLRFNGPWLRLRKVSSWLLPRLGRGGARRVGFGPA